MAEPFLTEIRLVPFNFAPTNWAQCNGQLLPISQHTAVYALVGPVYGGDGTSNFALPNLQGSVAMGAGQGPGLTSRALGESGGTSTVTLNSVELPSHSHGVTACEAWATTHSPVGAHPSRGVHTVYGSAVTAMASPQVVVPVGGNQPHNNMQPYLVMNYVIALYGVFPARP